MNNKVPSQAKVSRVQDLKKLISEAKSIAVVDYTGLNVAQATELRKTLKAAGGEMKVEKNTLFKIAADQKDWKLEGLSAFIFANADEISPLKIITDFIKKNSLLSFKAGIYQDKILSAVEVEALAKTPSRETSVAKVMYLLNYHTSKLVRTLDALAKAKGGDTN